MRCKDGMRRIDVQVPEDTFERFASIAEATRFTYAELICYWSATAYDPSHTFAEEPEFRGRLPRAEAIRLDKARNDIVTSLSRLASEVRGYGLCDEAIARCDEAMRALEDAVEGITKESLM